MRQRGEKQIQSGMLPSWHSLSRTLAGCAVMLETPGSSWHFSEHSQVGRYVERTADKLMCWLLPTSYLLLVKVAPWSLNYSVLSGLLLGFSRQLLEKQLNLGIGAPVASATVGTKKATKDQPFPWGRQRQLVVLGEETRSGLGLWPPAWSGCSRWEAEQQAGRSGFGGGA